MKQNDTKTKHLGNGIFVNHKLNFSSSLQMAIGKLFIHVSTLLTSLKNLSLVMIKPIEIG